MSATQATVTSTQVAVKYRRNAGSLSIDTSAESRPTYRPTYRSSLERYVDRHIGRDVGRHRDRGVRKLHMMKLVHKYSKLKGYNVRQLYNI